MIVRLSILLLTVISMSVLAQEFSAQALLGKWEFTAYAERSSPDDRTPVGAVFEFRPNGVLITTMRDTQTESSYSVDGDTFRYQDANGEQVWTVREFEPDISIVLENRSTLMFLERR